MFWGVLALVATSIFIDRKRSRGVTVAMREPCLSRRVNGALLARTAMFAVIAFAASCESTRTFAPRLCEVKGNTCETPEVGDRPSGDIPTSASTDTEAWPNISDGGRQDAAIPDAGAYEMSTDACEPVSERGCLGETPWCLGEGERNANGAWLIEPRCVECEEDSHCAWPYVPQGTTAACLEHRCVGCTRQEHCTSAEASRCDFARNTCVECDGVGQCAHLGETPVCDLRERRCVELPADDGGVD